MTERYAMETFADGSSVLIERNVDRIDFKRGDKVLVCDPTYWFIGVECQKRAAISLRWRQVD